MQLHDTITRLRAPLVSAGYGNQARDWASATSEDFLVHWSTKTVTETVGDAASTATRVKIFGGPDLDLVPSDRVTFGGATYELDGQPMLSYRQGSLHHVRAMLKRVTTGA
jgi:hypothetical protein